MFRLLACLSLLRVSCFAGVDQAWLGQAEKNMDQDTVVWLREKMREELVNMHTIAKRPIASMNKQCQTGDIAVSSDAPLFVFISFSVPESTWISLSKEVARLGGMFVLRGLPNNSFVELATRLYSLKKNGLAAQVQINPILFEEYDIKKVPAFVVPGEANFDKVSGNISVAYALDLMDKQGETEKAKTLKVKLLNN